LAHVSTNFSISGAPNGGYLSVLCIDAAAKLSPHLDCISLQASFLSKAVEGSQAELTAKLLASGKSTTQVQVISIQ
jgi:hypothetical protein